MSRASSSHAAGLGEARQSGRTRALCGFPQSALAAGGSGDWRRADDRLAAYVRSAEPVIFRMARTTSTGAARPRGPAPAPNHRRTRTAAPCGRCGGRSERHLARGRHPGARIWPYGDGGCFAKSTGPWAGRACFWALRGSCSRYCRQSPSSSLPPTALGVATRASNAGCSNIHTSGPRSGSGESAAQSPARERSRRLWPS